MSSTPAEREVARAPAKRTWPLAEALLAVELAGLSAFAFSRSVLDTFGRSPETFVARGAGPATIVAFGVAVTILPVAVLAVVGLATRPLGARARGRAHIGLVAVVGGLALWRLGQEILGVPGEATRPVVLGLVGGALLGLLRARVRASRSFFRYMGAASVVFLVHFLFVSQTSTLVLDDGPQLDAAVVAGVAADLGDEPPDVVVLVFDALPTMSLLDGTGHIDAELYPNFSKLAGDATWYRNNTTVSAFTLDAVPSLLTGRHPSTNEDERSGPGEDNLFSLLGASYEMHVGEQFTRECPSDVCSASTGGTLGTLLGDAADTWTRGVAEGGGNTDFELPGLNDRRIYDESEEWIEDLVIEPGGRPDLVFHHMVIPHEPWRVTDDGTYYDGGNPPTGYFVNGWTRSGIEVGRQRHILQVQAADRLLGMHLDALREAGMYDDALVVVTADHGAAFVPRNKSRGLTRENYEQIMWTPLLVKQPGQTAPGVDDRDVRSVDVLPTIADVLGVDIPWSVDGEAIGNVTHRDAGTKPFDDHKLNGWRPEDGAEMLDVPVEDALERVLAADPVEWTGPDAVWKRTTHGDLFGRAVDDLTVGEDAARSIAVEGLDELDDISLDKPLPIEIVGRTDLATGTFVAYALNDTIGAVSVVEEGGGPDSRLVHGIVPPPQFVQGVNELEAYLITGTPGAEVLQRLTLTGR